RGREIPRRGAAHALWRDRAPLDLWRSVARGGAIAGRRGDRVPPAAAPARRAELIFKFFLFRKPVSTPHQVLGRLFRDQALAPTTSATPITTSTIPAASGREVGCLNTKLEIAWANSTSTRPSVRTLAAVAIAKARNQNSDASAPKAPANRDGRQALMMATSTGRSRNARESESRPAATAMPMTRVKVAAPTN